MYMEFPIFRVFDTIMQSLFDARKIPEPSAKPLKRCLKDDGDSYFVVIKFKKLNFASAAKFDFTVKNEPLKYISA